jgi:hypothetical protein
MRPLIWAYYAHHLQPFNTQVIKMLNFSSNLVLGTLETHDYQRVSKQKQKSGRATGRAHTFLTASLLKT